MLKNSKQFLVIGSLMMALAIIIGAFGAHGLKNILDDSLMEIFKTGVSYQFYNTLGLFVISFMCYLLPFSKKLLIAGYFVFFGTVIFSFSLYALVLLKLSFLGAITPIGGTLMIFGWFLAAYAIFKDLKIESN